MKVIVNRTELEIFRGAKVADAIRMYFVHHKKALPKTLPKVEDRYGNTVAPDGALSEGSRLIIKKNNQ